MAEQSPKGEENTVGKGEIARKEQSLLFPQCFNLRHILQICKNKGLFGKGLTLSQTGPGFYVSAIHVFNENTVGKGEIACNEQFLLFPTLFSTHFRSFLPLASNLKLSSADAFSLEQSKI